MQNVVSSTGTTPEPGAGLRKCIFECCFQIEPMLRSFSNHPPQEIPRAQRRWLAFVGVHVGNDTGVAL